MTESNRKPNTTCKVCGKSIYRRPCEIARNQRGFFCNQVCYGKSQRKEVPCFVCDKLILSGANKITCSRACANKNRTGITYKNRKRPLKDKVKTYREQKKRIMKSRGEHCERCNYDIYQILQIHHIDRNRENNNFTNLELLCPNCHAKEHYLKK